jgi:hypothetical protein
MNTNPYTPDPYSQTFMWFKSIISNHLEAERSKLETDMEYDKTVKSRGRIQVLKTLLSEMEKLSTR